MPPSVVKNARRPASPAVRPHTPLDGPTSRRLHFRGVFTLSRWSSRFGFENPNFDEVAGDDVALLLPIRVLRGVGVQAADAEVE